MNILSLGNGLDIHDKKELQKKYPFLKWGLSSIDSHIDLRKHFISLEIHQKMVEDLDMTLIDLIMQQQSKEPIEVLLIQFQSLETIKHENALKFLEGLSKKLHKQKIKLWIYPKNHQPYKDFLVLFKKMKLSTVSLVFNPSDVFLQKTSIISLYKVLKQYIGCVVAEDITPQKHPELIGYGQASIIPLFKQMIKDRYQGSLFIDPKFESYLDTLKHKQQGFFKFLHKKDIDHYQVLKTRLKVDEKKDITMLDVYDNQLETLSIIFNLR